MQSSPLFDIIARQNSSGLSFEDFLKKVTRQHPYFTPAQFFLLQQMKETDAAYQLQAAKTAVLFNNPHWLHFQLLHPEVADAVANEIVTTAPSKNADNNDDEAIITTAAEPVFIETAVVEENEVQVSNAEVRPQQEEQILFAENADNNDDEVIITETTEPIFIETPVVEEDEIQAGNAEVQPQPEEQILFAENADNNDDEAVAEKQPLTEEQQMLAENPEIYEEEAITEEEIAPIKITMPDMENSTPSETAPTFEPMHLVDYFASQGIKLSDEVQTADKLGKQLKSFTEWLKTMKKIHTTDTEANAGISDIAIQALAAKSNKEGEIVTEAMAEVLLQQGKVGKAMEVYQKLSLLNPSKSAFFAAKIEQLKGS